MRWPIFAIAAYGVMVLQVGLAQHLAVASPFGPIEPRFVLILAVFIALSAAVPTTIIACGLLGVLVDLTNTFTVVRLDDVGAGGQTIAITIIGPYTLGFMAGGYLVTQMRPMLFRQHPLTMATMTLVAGAAVHLIVLGIFSIRRWYEPMEHFSAWTELAGRGLSLLYTAVLGAILSWPLSGLNPLFNFTTAKKSRRA